MKHPVIAISTGCPSSIGPEISVEAAAKLDSARPLLVGDLATLRRAASARKISPTRLVEIRDVSEIQMLRRLDIAVWAGSQRLSKLPRYGHPDREAGAAQLAYVDEALRLVTTDQAAAMTTAPVSKHAIATSGAKGARNFLGHTEHLARRLGANEVVMAFWSEELVVSLVTTHLPLGRVPRAIHPEGVASSIYWLGRLIRDLGKRKPRIVVASLNPHAGESGLLGDEETRLIEPGVRLARARFVRDGIAIRVDGPLGAETAFRKALAKDYDAVVAMYHDQATIPMKVLSFGDAVNITLGLPIIRTSVDHGKAYDLAGKGTADVSGMTAALSLAVRLAARKRTSTLLNGSGSRARS